MSEIITAIFRGLFVVLYFYLSVLLAAELVKQQPNYSPTFEDRWQPMRTMPRNATYCFRAACRDV